MTDFNTFEKDRPEYVKIFNEKLYQAKNGRTPQQVYDEDLTHTERTFVDILGMKPGAQQISNGGGLGATNVGTSVTEGTSTGFGSNTNSGFNQDMQVANSNFGTQTIPDFTIGGTAPRFRGDYSDYLTYDGQNLSFLNGKTNEVMQSYPATSGASWRTCKQYQSDEAGPVPEGRYNIKQSAYNNGNGILDMGKNLFLDAFVKDKLSIFDSDVDYYLSGLNNAPMFPQDKMNTYNRSGFKIRGGEKSIYGNEVNLSDKMKEFEEQYQKRGYDMDLRVKYPNDCW